MSDAGRQERPDARILAQWTVVKVGGSVKIAVKLVVDALLVECH